ncbi:MAG: GTPase Era [Rhodospirillaceae bacterium]|jgi:GTP-binding protein Era|nr:GTPase Era [Rhodospirillaceae bacterium]MBT3928747.1 GTPase Era [Rhodospirillaceae bacterium]MBT5038625.1 GTPase Era [Rhodospirillaceae bacterium]MBT6829956.1 GTPase Era [Rhodospirillaceae bacterium]MBT7293665.1 GTPase Era [Rhodospirillaceae bacterium]
MMAKMTYNKRAGFVAILGAPNVGKSTLINRLVGAKVSIVSPKVQTTRARVRGIRIVGAAQLVLVDTPGIFHDAKRRLERAMVHAAWSGAQDADAILLLIDAERGLDSNTRNIRDGLIKSGRKAVVAINKIDQVAHEKLLPLAASLDDGASTERIFMISALDGHGVEDLLDHLVGLLPKGPWLYPEDQLSDISDRLLAAEITREKLFLQLHQELPYSLTVETESWRELKDGSVRIEQIVYVSRSTHKAMVLGKGGQRIKSVGQDARNELQDLLDRRVHLFLFVKVREGWHDDPERYRDLGLEFNS